MTVCRIILVPVVFILVRSGSPWAVAVFALAALTDLIDGPLARRSNNVTEIGRILDPFADRLFIIGVVVALYLRNAVPPLWALGLLIARDVVILSGSLILRLRNRKLSVIYLGKVATAVLLVSIFLLIAGSNFGLWVFFAGLALYMASGLNYLVRGVKLLYAGDNNVDDQDDACNQLREYQDKESK